tara:strand:+ start:2592 stop:2855 length:264 start_codon:yes stop_codon:yes gene_type:complete
VRKGAFGCSTFLADKLNQEAAVQGCRLIGAARKKQYRLYEIPCGHEQEVQLGDMRFDIFLCQTCEEAYRRYCQLNVPKLPRSANEYL